MNDNDPVPHETTVTGPRCPKCGTDERQAARYHPPGGPFSRVPGVRCPACGWVGRADKRQAGK